MKWLHPEFLYALPVLLVILGITLIQARQRRTQLRETFAGKGNSQWSHSGASPVLQRWDSALLALAVVSLILALARPLYFSPGDRAELQGTPYLVALDVSRSMLAPDIKPSRYAALTNKLDRFFTESRGDRIGLITFSGVAYLNAPLTADTAALRTILTYLNPAATADPGSSMASALDRAVRYFTSNQIPRRTVLLVSDGEDLDPKTLSVARSLNNNHQLTIHTLGVGTLEGSRIPAYRAPIATTNLTGIPTTNAPQPTVITKLDENNLRRIAQAGGGRYFRFGTQGDGLQQFRNEVLKSLAEKEAREDLENYKEACVWPLTLAALSLIARLVLGSDRRVRTPSLPSILDSRS